MSEETPIYGNDKFVESPILGYHTPAPMDDGE